MSEEAAFLEALKANSADDTTRLVYADWLDEHGESAKAEYLRLVVALASKSGELTGEETEGVQLLALAGSIPAEWRTASGSHFHVVFRGLGPGGDKIKAIKCIRELAHCGLGEAKTLCEQPPSNLLGCVPLEYAVAARDYVQRENSVNVVLSTSASSTSQIVRNYQIVTSYFVWQTNQAIHTVRRAAQLAFAKYIAAATGTDVPIAIGVAPGAQVILAEGLELFRALQRLDELQRSLPVNAQEVGWRISVNIRPTPQ